jgi:hypothetical protein
MIEFKDVMNRIRQILLLQRDKNRIFDKELAEALHLDPQYYAVIKKRNKVPYEAVAHFAKNHNINMNWILFEKTPQYI